MKGVQAREQVVFVIAAHQQDSASDTLAISCSGAVTGANVTVSCDYTIDYVLHLFGFRETSRHTTSASADLVQN